MRNLRKIFESLGFFKRSPVLSIKDMAARINSGDQTAEDLVLFNRIIDAVVAIAEGDEDKASTPYQGLSPLKGEDIAHLVHFVTTLPAHVCVNDLVVTPTAQASSMVVHRRT